MQLYDPSRPEASPGRPALLIDGSPVPNIHVLPLFGKSDFLLTVWLRVGNMTYAPTYRTALNGEELLQILNDYRESPEDALQTYFGWKARSPTSFRKIVPSRPFSELTKLADADLL